MPVDDLEERLDFLTRSGIDEVRFLGGEPTLHPDFVVLVERALAASSEITVFSNGLMPERIVSCLASVPVDRCTVVVNVNEPLEADSNGAYRRQRETIGHLGERAMLGFNIYRTDFQADFLLELVVATGCTPNIRLSMAQPCLSGTNRHIHPNQYRPVAIKITHLAQLAAESGITLDFDCGFVRCMFSSADLKALEEAGAHVGWRCNPILDVDIEGNVIHCYPLAQLASLPLASATDTRALARVFEEQTDGYRQAGVYPECSGCGFKVSGQCTGGCLAATMRRFRSTPFHLEVPAEWRDAE
jgi:radical SAM protein with 4Fe4S-binding SPASM domain